jgi:hypothetical protein
MDMTKKARRLLYRSLEDRLTEKDQNILLKALKDSPELRKEKAALLRQRELLARAGGASFGPSFAERVERRLKALASESSGWDPFYDTLLALFRRFAIAGALALLLLLSYNLKLGDKLAPEEVYFASDAAYAELQQMPLF